jgi:hypothetical protein
MKTLVRSFLIYIIRKVALPGGKHEVQPAESAPITELASLERRGFQHPLGKTLLPFHKHTSSISFMPSLFTKVK